MKLIQPRGYSDRPRRSYSRSRYYASQCASVSRGTKHVIVKSMNSPVGAEYKRGVNRGVFRY